MQLQMIKRLHIQIENVQYKYSTQNFYTNKGTTISVCVCVFGYHFSMYRRLCKEVKESVEGGCVVYVG